MDESRLRNRLSLALILWMHGAAASTPPARCAGALTEASVYAAPAPDQVMSRPTRLQKLLETTHFNDLAPAQMDSEVSALFASPAAPVRWRPEPDYVPNYKRYFEYFALEDLRLMATQPRYAKKVAGDLRTYANLHLGGHTSQFRNDDVQRAAALLVDRHRLLTHGVPELNSREDLNAEARHAGLKAGKLSELSYLTGAAPTELGNVVEPRGDHVESVRGAFARRFGNDQIPPGRFIGLTREISYNAPMTRTLDDPEDLENVVMNALRHNLGAGDDDNPLRGYAQIRSLQNNYLTTAESARAKLTSFEVNYGYQYRLKPVHVIKIPAPLGNLVGGAVVAAIPRLPVERIAAWRRIFRVAYTHEGFTEYTRHRPNAVPETLRGYLYDVEAWRDFTRACK